MASLLNLAVLVCFILSVAATGEKMSLRSEVAEAEPAETVRELVGYIGRQIQNNCASIFNNQILNGRMCASPCNNPCARLDTTGYGCGVYSYCTCYFASNDQWHTKPPIAKCAPCPYIKQAGTTCPGDGFYYDKSYPEPPIILSPPSPPPVKMAPQCYGNTFGACVPGQYCRQKSTDWTYVCTACPTGLTCPGDGTRKGASPTPKPTLRK